MRAIAFLGACRRLWLAARLDAYRIQSLPSLRRAVHQITTTRSDTNTERQLLVDVSVLIQHDAGTGIQRVTKALLSELSASPPQGYVVRTILASRWRRYRYAESHLASSKLRVRPGDIFLGLDFTSRILPRHHFQFLGWREAGVSVCVLVHDLLPLLHPQWFTRRNARAYRAWIRAVAIHADAVVCVSRVVSEQFRAWLRHEGFDLNSFPPVKWLHHGVHRPPATSFPTADYRVAKIARQPYVLMVGTIEPRKGYAQALDTFEAIWQDGNRMQLVIVGRAGWNVSPLLQRFSKHSEAGKRFHWFDDANDTTLDALYQSATGLLLASEAEGFGLPIIEAAIHGKPLLLRDIAIFREIAGDCATYFSAPMSVPFTRELQDWLVRALAGTAPLSRGIAVQTWARSAEQLIAHLPISLPARQRS